jgi:AbiV family abortive infection protein
MIPRSRVQEGIEYCKKNVSDFLDDARMMMSKERLNHAYLSVHFAIEEFGKAAILSEAYRLSTDDPIPINAAVFGQNGKQSHKIKTDKAWTLLDPSLKILHNGSFGKGFSKHGFDTDTESSPETRLECAYVDFKDGLWITGDTIDEPKLSKLIVSIEQEVKKL